MPKSLQVVGVVVSDGGGVDDCTSTGDGAGGGGGANDCTSTAGITCLKYQQYSKQRDASCIKHATSEIALQTLQKLALRRS